MTQVDGPVWYHSGGVPVRMGGHPMFKALRKPFVHIQSHR